jgi:triacylglycerol lipase
MNKGKFSDTEKKAATKILNLNLPNYRKAYSDKTAFLMASLCELSYIVWESRFKGLEKKVVDKFQSRVIDKLSNTKNQTFLTDFVVSLLKDNDDSKNTLIEELTAFSLQVDDEISWISDPVTDTQAFIAFNDEYAVLVFRGTEATSIKDIRTDTKARLITSTSNGLVHEGFQKAFDSIEETINERLKSDQLKDKPLYITGHSLGGALATIATREFKIPIEIAASYTFGSPRVGNEDWINRIKSPVYRLVNAADSVTMLPPGSIPMSGLSFIAGLVPSFGDQLKAWLSKYNGYIHAGNMRYLTNCIPNEHKEVRLLYSVSFLYRIKAVIQHSLFRQLVKDHSISVYRKKLTIIATKRNKLTLP